MKFTERNLTEGPLARQIIAFSIPLVCTNLLQVLFNVADIAVVGRFAGPEALGSVGSTTILITLFTGFLIGLASAVNVLTALYFGAGNEQETRETVHMAAAVCLLVGLELLGAGEVFARAILTLMGTRQELIDGAVLYLQIYFLGMPALAVYNFGNAVFSAVGDTKKPLLYLSLAGVINVVLNLFFVLVCDLSVAGVALASIISQFISAILIVRALFRVKDSYGLCRNGFRFRFGGARARQILALGIPSGCQTAIFAFANLFVQAGVNTFSATLVAGNAAATNADALVYDTMAAFYTACGSFIGQNYGAGKADRVRRSYYLCLAYSLGIGLAMGLSIYAMGPRFLSFFTKDAQVIEMGMMRLQVMSISYGFSAFMDCTIAASRGLGKSTVPTVIVILGSCVFRIFWIYTVFAYFGTITSLYLLYIFSWGLTAIAEMIYFAKVYRETLEPALP